jgi:pimeloyl-ACP methyl ester carboxylesterase
LTSPSGLLTIPASCGSIDVPEDWDRPTESSISLRFAIVRGVSRTLEPDPLFFFAGGPGQSALESFPDVTAGFDRIHRHRDIVLIDQRGTGSSSPMDCETPEGATLLSGEQAFEIIKSCAAKLHRDPSLYTTEAAVRDFDRVREQLGYQRVNLYGISYGTRVALSYLRMFPDRVRSVMLDGVLPQDHALGADVDTNAQRALDLLWARCKGDPGCDASFPSVAEDFQSLLSLLEEEPQWVRTDHPVTGEPVKDEYTLEDFVQTVRFTSYAAETVSLLPLLIHRAADTGDFGPWLAQSVLLGALLERSMSAGLNISVLCAEDFPYWPPEEPKTRPTYLGDRERDDIKKYCSVWPYRKVAATFKQPVQSRVPALLLSGEADPITPPAYGEHAARTLHHSLHIVVPGQGHGVIHRGCLPRLAEQFIDRADPNGLDTSCVADTAPTSFFVDMAGPEP